MSYASPSSVAPSVPPPPPSPPPPPPLPQPPPPPGVRSRTLYFASVELVVAGTVEAFDEKERLRIANVLAAAMQVDASRFTVTLGAASVRLIILIDASDEQAATSLINSIGAELMPSAAAASSLLGVTVTSSPLLEVSTRELLLPLPPSPPPPPTPPPPESTASLLAVGVAILSAIVWLALVDLLWCGQHIWRKQRARMSYYLANAARQPSQQTPLALELGEAEPHRIIQHQARVSIGEDGRVRVLKSAASNGSASCTTQTIA